MPERPAVEAFILNHNGEALLAECLPSWVEACRRASCRLTVIDNDSRDGSLELLKRDFPQVDLRRSPNRVLCSFNDAVRDSHAEIVLLLNNDLKAGPNCIEPLVAVFRKHEGAFLAAPKAYTFDGKRYEGSLSKMSFKNGVLRVESRFAGYETKIDTPGRTMQAGFGAYKRSVFLELGGFDDLYLPGTVEDSDLCFRAWRAGYACYYEPKSLVYHKGQATFKKTFGRSKLFALNQRNLHLFVWKNVKDARLWIAHLFFLPIRPLFFLLKGRYEFLWGLLWAFSRLPAAVSRRRTCGPPLRRRDRDIFRLSESL